jgi:hypothetical protein
VKISNKKFSFFSTLNQYFPHIPYVASKNVEYSQNYKKSDFGQPFWIEPQFLRKNFQKSLSYGRKTSYQPF